MEVNLCSYKEMLIRNEDLNGNLKEEEDLGDKEKEINGEEFDFSGFQFIEEIDGEKPYLVFIILPKEEKQMCKHWQKKPWLLSYFEEKLDLKLWR